MRLSGHGTDGLYSSRRRGSHSDWLRSSAIATGRRSTFSGLGSFSCRPTACRCWRWRARRAPAGRRYGVGSSASPRQGVDGLLRDKTRKPGKNPLPEATVAKILALPCGEPPGKATHWTGRMVAQAAGCQSARRAAHLGGQPASAPPHPHLQAHPAIPAFAAKVEDVVGLYMDPPVHAVVVSIDEKSRSRRSTAPSPACRSSPANAAP